MRKAFWIPTVMALSALFGFGGLALAQQGGGLSRSVGVYDSTRYAAWGASIAAGNSATGSQTITVCPAYVTLADGRQMDPFTTSTPLTIDPQNPAVTETVTPTAVSLVTSSNGTVPSGFQSCENITGTFSYTHGPSLNPRQVISGDQGIAEAINDAENNGGGMVYWMIDSGPVNLSTSAANTTLSAVNIPTRSTVVAAVARVETAITGCSGGWSIGYSSGTEFTSANTTLTAGTTTDSSTLQPAVAFNASATPPIAHCTTSDASAGAIHVRVFGYKMASPNN